MMSTLVHRLTALAAACGLSAAAFVPAAVLAQAGEEDVEAGSATKKVEKKASLLEEEKKVEAAKPKKDSDALVKGQFDYEAFDRLGFTRKEQEIQFKKSTARRQMIKTMEELIERTGGRTDNAADLYFRLAETWWDETHYQYLLERADYDKKVTAWEAAPENMRGPQPTQPVENYQKSITFYEKVLQQFPGYARIDEVLYRLGKAALQQGKALGDRALSNKGVTYLNQLVQKHQASVYIPQTHLALAEHFFEANNLTLAKMNYERITQNFKNATMYNYALYKLGWVYYNLREFRRTIETFQQVVKEVGKTQERGKIEFRDQALKDLIQAFAELDRGWPEAKEYFTAVEGDKAMWPRLEKMAEIYVSTDKDDNAIELFTHFIENKPVDIRCVDWHDEIIGIRKKIGNFPDIEAAARKFLAFTDERTSPWVAANKTKKEAEEAVDKQRRMGEGLLLYIANHYHQAAQKIEEETKLPEQARAQYARAADDYKEFVRRYPTSKKAYIVQFYFAEILYDQLQDYAGANEAYKKSIALDPTGEFVEDAALGVLYSVEELMKREHACYKDGKWTKDPTCPTLIDPKTGEETKIVKTAKKPDLTESEIKEAQVPKKQQDLHPLEADYVMAADTYVKLMEQLKEKGKLGGKGKKVPDIMYLAATTYYERGQYDKAVDRLERVYKFDEKNKVAEIAVKTLIDVYARHKDWVKIEEWARLMLKRTGRIVLETKDLRKYIAVSVAEQAVELAERKDFDGAHKKYDTILAEFKQDEPELAATSLYNKATLYEIQKEDVKAITTYERVVKEFPKSKIAPEAMFNIGMIYESMTQFKEAADSFLNMTKFRDNADAAQALINAGQILTALQANKEAAAAYDKFISVASGLKGEDDNVKRLKGLVADAEMEKGHVFEKMGTEGAKLAAGVYNGLVAKYPSRADLHVEALGRRVETLRLADAVKNRKEVAKAADAALKAFELPAGKAGRSAYYAAQAMFYKAEYDYDDFGLLSLTNVKKMSGLLPMLQKKAEALKKAEVGYFAVVDATSAGQGRAYAAAAMYKVGMLYYEFKEDLFKAPIPTAIKGNAELEDAYRLEIEKIAVPIEEQALSGLRNAINVAHNLGVYNKWSKLAGDRAAEVSPKEYPTVEKDPNLPVATTAVSANKATDAATSAAFLTTVRRGKFTVSFKPEEQKAVDPKKGGKPTSGTEGGKPASGSDSKPVAPAGSDKPSAPAQ